MRHVSRSRNAIFNNFDARTININAMKYWDKKKWRPREPRVNGHLIILSVGKLEEAIKLCDEGRISPDEINYYLVAEWN